MIKSQKDNEFTWKNAKNLNNQKYLFTQNGIHARKLFNLILRNRMGKNESDSELRFYKKKLGDRHFHEMMQFLGDNPVMKGCNFWARDRHEMMQFLGDRSCQKIKGFLRDTPPHEMMRFLGDNPVMK